MFCMLELFKFYENLQIVNKFVLSFNTDDLQTITPSEMSSNFRGFGISFSSYPHGDVDSNGLEDLAIGKEISS